MKNKRGFTLIELLVVVSVITILLAILIPSLGRARKQARKVVCITNEHSILMATRFYVSDWNTSLTGNGHGSTYGAWDYQLFNKGVKQVDYYKNTAGRESADRLRWCPETPNTRHDGVRLGSSSSPWDCRAGNNGGSTGSYAINDWIKIPGTVTSRKSAPPSVSDFYRVTRSLKEDIIPTFVDAVWHDILPHADDPYLTTIEDPETIANNNRTLGDTAINRHAGAVNVVFYDGHAESVKLPDLWTLKWSANWNRSVPQVLR